VACLLGPLEQWRNAILIERNKKVHGVGQHPIKIALGVAPYAVPLNVRMIAESVLSKQKHEDSHPLTYGASGLIWAHAHRGSRFTVGFERVQARSVKRFQTGQGDDKRSIRARHFRKPLADYAGRE
jgi:hypothetical protein